GEAARSTSSSSMIAPLPMVWQAPSARARSRAASGFPFRPLLGCDVIPQPMTFACGEDGAQTDLCRRKCKRGQMRSARAIIVKIESAGAAAASARAASAAARTAGQRRLRLHRDQALALRLLARELARAADCFGLLAGAALGG